MPYAVFEDDEKLSRTFPTKQEALRKANDAGLVVDELRGEPVLDSNLSIRPCPPDPAVPSDEELDWSPEKPALSGNQNNAGSE
jgi:hypothetical protein